MGGGVEGADRVRGGGKDAEVFGDEGAERFVLQGRRRVGRHGADRVDLARAGTERDATRVALPVASVRHAVHLRDRVQGGALARR